MPIRKVEGGYKWGGHGHVYPTREGAENQAAAAHAHGFTGDEDNEMAMAILSLKEELQAIREYQGRIEVCKDDSLCGVLKHNLKEEHDHARGLLNWIKDTLK